MRYWLTGVSSIDPALDIGLLTVLTVIFLVFAAKVFEEATIED
jgi:ABC-2 type transport system permease protein